MDLKNGEPGPGSSFTREVAEGETTMQAPLVSASRNPRGISPWLPDSTSNRYDPGQASPLAEAPDDDESAESLASRTVTFDTAVLEGKVMAVSVLFADLRGFTAAAELVAPRRMAVFLNDYLTVMIDVILARHGMVQDFVGDGILAVFGAPSRDPDHAWHAAVSAIEMQTALECLGRRSEADRQIRPSMGVSVHSGEVFAGTVGSPRQWKYAAVGDTVNVASRLEGLNRDLGTSIVMSGQTIALLSNRVEVRSRGWFPVRGRNHPIEVFELLGLRHLA